MIPQIKIVMASHFSFEKRRLETLRQFANLGFSVTTLVSTANSPNDDEVGRIAAEAVDLAYSEGKALLFIEDDININARFPLFLNLAYLAHSITYLYLHETDGDTRDGPPRYRYWYPEGIANHIDRKEWFQPALYGVEHAKNLYGSQCVFLPAYVVERIHKSDGIRKLGKSFDVYLNQHHKTQTLPVYVGLPMSVQHRSDKRTGWKDPRPWLKRKSITYDWEAPLSEAHQMFNELCRSAGQEPEKHRR